MTTVILIRRGEEIVAIPEIAGALCIIPVACPAIDVTLDLNLRQSGLITAKPRTAGTTALVDA
jgi:hypothetical protein